MKKILLIILLAILYLPLSGAEGDNFKIEIASFYRNEIHKTLGQKNELFFQGFMKLNNWLTVGSGFSTTFQSIAERFYIHLEVNNFPNFLSYRISALWRDFPEDNIRENTFMPRISLITKYLEIDLGGSYQIIQLGENFLHSLNFLLKIQLNILHFKHFNLSYCLSNFDLFKGGYIADMSHIIKAQFPINNKWIIWFNVSLHDAGQMLFVSFLTSIYSEIGLRILL